MSHPERDKAKQSNNNYDAYLRGYGYGGACNEQINMNCVIEIEILAGKQGCKAEMYAMPSQLDKISRWRFRFLRTKH